MKRVRGVRCFSGTRNQELKIDGVKHAIAVASGKGGVGKSTTAGNFPFSFSFYFIFLVILIFTTWMTIRGDYVSGSFGNLRK